MYRQKIRFKVKNMQGWNGLLGVFEEMNAIARELGHPEAEAWTQSFGPFNELELTLDFPDLGTYQRQTQQFFSDERVVKLIGKVGEFTVDDAGYSEMWERASKMGPAS